MESLLEELTETASRRASESNEVPQTLSTSDVKEENIASNGNEPDVLKEQNSKDSTQPSQSDEEPPEKKARIESVAMTEDTYDETHPGVDLPDTVKVEEEKSDSSSQHRKLSMSDKQMSMSSEMGGHSPSKRDQERQAIEEERRRMQALVASFSEEQLNRYEMYKRSAFPKTAVKRLMQTVSSGCPISQNVAIAMAGIAKVFVGEVVDTALDVLRSTGQEGDAVQPKHIREAIRRLRSQGKVPNYQYKKVAFHRP